MADVVAQAQSDEPLTHISEIAEQHLIGTLFWPESFLMPPKKLSGKQFYPME